MTAKRQPLDQYETAPWQVDALVDHLPELSGTVWCPTVGDGALLRQLRLRCPGITGVITNDISPALRANFHDDATLAASWLKWIGKYGTPDWVVDNFPFNVQHAIIRHAWPAVKCGLVALSRISYVEPTQERGAWLANHPRQLQVALERYSFTGNGKSDNATCEWLVWSKIPLQHTGGYTAYGYKRAWSTSSS